MSSLPVPPARTLGQLLAQLEGGRFQDLATDSLRDLLDAISEHAAETGGNAGGSLIITFKFKVKKKIVSIGAEIKTKKPEQVREDSIFWFTPAGDLSIYNPDQMQMAFRDVNEAPVRTIDGTAAPARTV